MSGLGICPSSYQAEKTQPEARKAAKDIHIVLARSDYPPLRLRHPRTAEHTNSSADRDRGVKRGMLAKGADLTIRQVYIVIHYAESRNRERKIKVGTEQR